MNDNERNFALHGTHHTACGRVLNRLKSQSALEDEAMDNPPAPITPVRHAIEGARAYASSRGLDDPHSGIDYSKVRTSRELLKNLGHHYDALPLDDPSAHKHFDAMRDEVAAQHHFMTHNLGIKTEVTDHDPYKNIHELRDDVVNNHRIKVLGTHATGGHPYFSNEDNDKFRAAHDFFGHLGTGRDFDRHGEEAAFQAHSRMFSHHALPALTSETRGQNGSLITNGHFGPQKIALLPKHLWHPGLAHTSSLSSGRDRIAVMVDGGMSELKVFAHVSGNSTNVTHCAFCGAGALIARSDGTIECDYCGSVFTVQVQPAYSGFPQTVDGNPYPWPGAPDPADVAGPGAVPPVDDMGEDDVDEDSDPDELDTDDDTPDFIKNKKKTDKDGTNKNKKKNPFAKGSSYRALNGAQINSEDFLAHIGILVADDKFKAAQAVLDARRRGEL